MPTVITKEVPAGSTRIHCPVCGTRDVAAPIVEKQETVMQNLVVPMGTHTTWWVKCSQCGTQLYSKVGPTQLLSKGPDELVGQVVYRVSLVHQFLAVAALVLSWMPGLGIFLGLIAWLVNRKTRTWPRKLSKFATLASITLHVLFVVWVLVMALSRR